MSLPDGLIYFFEVYKLLEKPFLGKAETLEEMDRQIDVFQEEGHQVFQKYAVWKEQGASFMRQWERNLSQNEEHIDQSRWEYKKYCGILKKHDLLPEEEK